MSEGEGVTQATHNNTPSSLEGGAQLEQWMASWLQTGTAVVMDPYESLETP